MSLAVAIVVVFLILLELRLWVAYSRKSAEKKLTKMCFGDAAQVERLVQRELQRNPGLTRAQAVRAAIESYQRDNR